MGGQSLPMEDGVTRLNPRALAAAAVTAAALACAACGSSSSPSAGSGSSSPPASPSSGSSSPTATQLTVQQAAPLLVQCFADKHLIPSSKLAAGKASHPRSDSSTWLHGGKVTGNQRFGDWYSNTGSAVTVNGKSIGTWVTAVAASGKAWPTATCGPVPG
jgi:hypothetical protein